MLILAMISVYTLPLSQSYGLLRMRPGQSNFPKELLKPYISGAEDRKKG